MSLAVFMILFVVAAAAKGGPRAIIRSCVVVFRLWGEAKFVIAKGRHDSATRVTRQERRVTRKEHV